MKKLLSGAVVAMAILGLSTSDLLARGHRHCGSGGYSGSGGCNTGTGFASAADMPSPVQKFSVTGVYWSERLGTYYYAPNTFTPIEGTNTVSWFIKGQWVPGKTYQDALVFAPKSGTATSGFLAPSQKTPGSVWIVGPDGGWQFAPPAIQELGKKTIIQPQN